MLSQRPSRGRCRTHSPKIPTLSGFYSFYAWPDKPTFHLWEGLTCFGPSTFNSIPIAPSSLGNILYLEVVPQSRTGTRAPSPLLSLPEDRLIPILFSVVVGMAEKPVSVPCLMETCVGPVPHKSPIEIDDQEQSGQHVTGEEEGIGIWNCWFARCTPGAKEKPGESHDGCDLIDTSQNALNRNLPHLLSIPTRDLTSTWVQNTYERTVCAVRHGSEAKTRRCNEGACNTPTPSVRQ
jgi:hypothetical protein